MQGRDVIEDDFLEDEDREGDVLILDPTLPQEHVPGFDMGK